MEHLLVSYSHVQKEVCLMELQWVVSRSIRFGVMANHLQEFQCAPLNTLAQWYLMTAPHSDIVKME